MKILVLMSKPRSKSGGFCNEACMFGPSCLDAGSFLGDCCSYLRQFAHLVMPDARAFLVPDRPHAPPAPRREPLRDGDMDTIDHVALAVPTVAGNLDEQAASLRQILMGKRGWHRGLRAVRKRGKTFHDFGLRPVVR